LPEKIRVLVVGSGKRIQKAFLPALELCRDQFEVLGIQSPHILEKQELLSRWSLSGYAAPADAPFKEADLVVVSVPRRQKYGILKRFPLGNYDLLIDTPAIGTILDRYRLNILNRFRRVLVAEDFIRYPQFTLLTQAAEQGALGTVERVDMSRIGYSYHGLALLRRFFGYARIDKMGKAPCLPGENLRIAMEFGGERTGLFSYPYSRDDGQIEIEGSERSLLFKPDFSGDVKRHTEADGSELFSVEAGNYQEELTMPAPEAHWGIDDSFMLFKIFGLRQIFAEYAVNRDTPFYPFEEGIYDSLLSSLTPMAKMIPPSFLLPILPQRGGGACVDHLTRS